MNDLPRTCHSIHAHHHHLSWDHSTPPVHQIGPGEDLWFDCMDASGGQLVDGDKSSKIGEMDLGKANPVTGPVFIDGAEPGDALVVHIKAFEASGWGWSALIPGFGLLADDFADPLLHHWHYDKSTSIPALFSSNARVPLKPFAGTIGLAPAETGGHSLIPPRRMGGNMDVRDLAAGTKLVLPVEVDGALFSIGDTHAAQGDGEVCGTAIESPMSVHLGFDLIKGGAPAYPRFQVKEPVTRHLDGKGYDVAMGIGPDLMAAARDACRNMIDLLCREQKLKAEEAYMLMSVCGDLRISEIVDVPNFVVSFYMPRIVFD